MSFLSFHEGRPLFVVQTGIVAWEDKQPIVDWRWKTVSILSRELHAAAALLWALVSSRPKQLEHVLRVYLAPVVPSMTEAQKRRLATALGKDPPGFSDTHLGAAGANTCVMSILNDQSAVDPRFLTDYRRCALLELESEAWSPSIGNACKTIADLGGQGLSTMLNQLSTAAILRVLERESHVVIQLIGSSEVSDVGVRCLIDKGVEQFHDIRALPQMIASFGH
jgi:hypothetical protein